ncbi:iron-sulfur cluster assembly scaffold protein [bacterium (Candidatus Gribaldobacteria) CG08_land_8_20_14_0_20_39_15]|uniref:Iron-sulfur cluster assembly scaffold protein n=1 Tax=bacterium (Candidatus Gribaldobacteria) CG08_land_8_20_14_0_20_39_15 TaxID=2014273 RepID=A0A2M6XUS4_9BACT|nr:MAG: iron-sulfur cluster assembly scaffold protein [bacterium (Candidatus Gribaldobacteria) CG08_land_8_20_14_0_20_39_15]
MIYSKKVLQHFNKPHNYGKMKNPDGVGEVGNVVCGDLMELFIKVAKNKKGQEIIKDVKFSTYGCLAAIASSSILTDLVKGKTLEQAMEFDRKEIVEELGGLPLIKIHCSVLAGDALLEAIHHYLTKNKKPIPEKLTKRHQQLQKEKEMIEKGKC